MLVKCISPRLNHTLFSTDANGIKKPRKAQVGDVFAVRGIPKAWRGLVAVVDQTSMSDTTPTSVATQKSAVVNPAGSQSAEDAKQAAATKDNDGNGAATKDDDDNGAAQKAAAAAPTKDDKSDGKVKEPATKS